MKVKSASEDAKSRPTLSDPMDCSLPGSFVRGIFQARVLEWGAIVCVKDVLCSWLAPPLWAAHSCDPYLSGPLHSALGVCMKRAVEDARDKSS